jgi:hypothetical protein
MKHFIFIAIIAVCGLSCQKTIEIQQGFDFDLIMLPVLTEVEADKPVEMRFTIRPIGGQYINTKYYGRFFLFSGKGILVNEDGEVFFPNDDYLLPQKQFRLYYTPSQGTSHQLEIVFFDNFGHEKTVVITFTIAETESSQT